MDCICLANMAATTRASGCAALALYRVMNSIQKTYKLGHPK